MFKENNELSFGFDLGIASVGWAVTNIKTNEIIDKGVYLFSEVNKSQERRYIRSLRRLRKRKLHRVERVYQIFERKGINIKCVPDANLLDKRIKSLYEKVELQDLVNIIIYYIKHRGHILYENERLFTTYVTDYKEGEYPCHIQKKILQNAGKYRGLKYVFMHEDYVREITQILHMQSKWYNDFLSGEVIDEIINILKRKRKFWEGPGGPKLNQLSKYGRYKCKEDIEKYNIDKNYNKFLYEQFIGKCKVYHGEKKTPYSNFYVEYFNIFNDLMGLRFDKSQINHINSKYFVRVNQNLYKLTSNSAQILIEEVLDLEKLNISKVIKELFFVEEFVKNSKNEIKISSFENYRKLRRTINNNEIFNIIKSDIDLYNDIMYVVQVSPDNLSRYEILKEKFSEYIPDDYLKVISNLNLENKYHSFSEKALKQYIKYMQISNENSTYVANNFANEIASDVEEYKIQKYISNNKTGELKYIAKYFVDELEASPQMKKTLRKAILVINRLFSKFGYPKYICIETAKVLLNSKQQKEQEKMTLDNQNIRKYAKDFLIQNNIEISKYNIDRFILYCECNQKCIFCDKELDFESTYITNILPVNKVYDDTYSNKCIACNICREKISNVIPMKFVDNVDNYIKRINKNKKLGDIRKGYLLFNLNIDKYKKKFKSSNLNDTAYASNEFANLINTFKKAYYRINGINLKLSVIKVPGQFTHRIREKYDIVKDREQKFHHAVDATIVSSIPNCNIGKIMNFIQNKSDEYWLSKLMDDYRDNINDNLYLESSIIENLKSANYTNTRVCLEVKKDINAKLFNSTINTCFKKDDNFFRISKIKNIYELEPKKVKDIFKKKLLCKEKDVILYNKLFDISNNYYDENINAFKKYCIENYNIDQIEFNPNIHGIRRNNSEKSPIVKSIKYYEHANMPFLLTKKNINKKESKLLAYNMLSTYCIRIYINKVTSEYRIMPIYRIFFNLDNESLNVENPYYKQIFKNYVGIDDTNILFYMDLFKNDMVRYEDEFGKHEGVIGCFNKVDCSIMMKNGERKITKNTKNIERINTDILGIYNFNI